jgi:hypothetical protein
VFAIRVAGWADADQENSGHRNALTCHIRHYSSWLSPRQPSEQSPKQRPHLSCLPTQWLDEPTQTERPEQRPHMSCPPPNLPGWASAEQSNRGQHIDLTCRARYHNGLLSQRRPREKRAEQRHLLSGPPKECLVEHTPTERTEVRASSSHFVPAFTVAG